VAGGIGGDGGVGASAARAAETRARATTRPVRQWGAKRPIDLKRIGDSHDPDDPYFNDFKARTLALHAVMEEEASERSGGRTPAGGWRKK
jgi:hypothetical protein